MKTPPSLPVRTRREIEPPLGPGIPSSSGADFLTTKLDVAVQWAQSNSLWPMPFGTACCAIEFMSVVSSHYDLARFGAEVVRFSPRQADLLIVAGTVVDKLAPVLKKIYDQMPEPKWVISMGVCASTGGFYRAYHVVQGIDEIVPVDVYVAGCPPTPENLIHGIMELQKKIQSGELARHRESKTFVPIRVGVDPDLSIPAYSDGVMAHLPGKKELPGDGRRRPKAEAARRPRRRGGRRTGDERDSRQPRPSISFGPVLEQKLGGRVTVEARPAFDIPTLVTDAATLKEAALFLRDDPAAAYDLFLDLASVDRSKLPGDLGAEGRDPLPGELHPLLDEAERAPAGCA